jgi:hypothetical protein
MADLISGLGAEVVSIPIDGQPNSTNQLLKRPDVQAVLRKWAPAHVVFFRPNFEVIEILKGLGLSPLSSSQEVARTLENKRNFRKMCSDEGLPVVPFATVPVKSLLENPDCVPVGWPRIVQTARGFGGKRTWLWEAGVPLPLSKRFLRHEVLVSPFIKGRTWTINAVVRDGQVLAGSPMLQITGDRRLHRLPFASSGVAIVSQCSEAISDELLKLAQAVGKMASKLGFIGFYGIDAIETDSGLKLIEMNARLTATLTLSTLSELAAGQLPLTVAHLLACMGSELFDKWVEHCDGVSRGKAGGHLILRSSEHEGPFPVEAGTYSAAAGALKRTADIIDWPSKNQGVIWPSGSPVGAPEEERCRIIFGDEILHKGQFRKGVDQLVELLQLL